MTKIVSKKSKGSTVALIAASWHADLVQIALQACSVHLKNNHIKLEVFEVPGSLEIPLSAKKCAKTKRFDAVIGFGLVVDGGIYRHEFVAQAILNGIMQVQLETEIPVFSCVLTPHHFHEHDTHHTWFKAHLAEKGKEAAHACIQFLSTLTQIK